MNGFSVFSILNKESIPIQFGITTILSLSQYFNSKAAIPLLSVYILSALLYIRLLILAHTLYIQESWYIPTLLNASGYTS